MFQRRLKQIHSNAIYRKTLRTFVLTHYISDEI